jgi:threonine 3-dehydrogenase
MHKEALVITGANGEIGHGLIEYLGKDRQKKIIANDLQELDPSLKCKVDIFLQGDVVDPQLFEKVAEEFTITTVFHLASILSTKAEQNPELAHRVNIEGTLNLFKLAVRVFEETKRPVKFLYPSSIAVYGLPDLEIRAKVGKVKEKEFCFPTTMYGCNKLYCEQLGRYFSNHYRQLQVRENHRPLDFRGLRFPGLISAATIPTGGTSDYGPEMLHAAARNEPYACFVRPDTQLPFMVMPDAIKALIHLEQAQREELTRSTYNVTSFHPTAQEIYEVTKKAFPGCMIRFEPQAARQGIVDSWPADIDDAAARRDWHWVPDYDQERAFEDYLIPAVKARYAIPQRKGC